MNAPDMFYCIDTTGTYDGMFDGERVMLSAGLAWNNPGNGFSLHVPDGREIFIDSGGFQATTRWGLDYPYEPEDYFEWAESIGANHVAGMDYACEPELHDSTVDYRVALTIEAHAHCLATYLDGDYSFQFIPVLQGYDPEDYRECSRRFKQEGLDTDYMAIGTVCKRKDPGAIERVLDVCDDEFPNAEWHLFGATLRTYTNKRLWGRFRSSDTAAWNWGAESKQHKKELFTAYRSKVESYRNAINSQSTIP